MRRSSVKFDACSRDTDGHFLDYSCKNVYRSVEQIEKRHKMSTQTTKKATASTAKTTGSKTTGSKITTATSLAKTKAEMPATDAALAVADTTAGDASAVLVGSPQPVVAGPVMRKRELINAVVAKSGIKKKDAKPVIEAMLSVLGSALQDGRELNLQPMGKVKVNREKKLAEGKVLIARIRQARDLPTSEVASVEDKKPAKIKPAAASKTPAAAE
jgi:DNA-binding protein HU-alpha